MTRIAASPRRTLRAALGLLLCAAACESSRDDAPGAGGAAAAPSQNGGGSASGAGGGSGDDANPGGAGGNAIGSAGTSGRGGDGSTAGSSGAAPAGGMGGAEPDAGSAGADGGGEPIDLPDGVSGLFPLPGASDVCPDPPLRLSFPSAPSVGRAGELRVFDADRPGQPVASVDFAAMNISDTIGGQTFNLPRQVYVDGNDVVVYLESRALDYGSTYYVTVDEGAILAPDSAAISITDSSVWRFNTRAAAPADRSSLGVALDGSGSFCSPQGALDAVPDANEAAVTIEIAAGTYHGVVYFTGKHSVSLRGAERRAVVISGVNNNELNPSTRTRALVGADDADGLIVERLTIHNLTPQGGSQAEALRLQNCDRCVVRDADILSLQDTLLWSGRIYARDCYIAGNVDFVWGNGVVYFDACEIKTVGRSGPIVQARNAASAYGYVFVDSRITSDPGLTGSTLGRIDASVYPGSHVAYVNCTLGSHISRAGWTITGGSAASLRFWEYQSRNDAGDLIDVSGRAAGSTQITAQQAASMRDEATVLGGWKPPE